MTQYCGISLLGLDPEALAALSGIDQLMWAHGHEGATTGEEYQSEG